MVKMRGGVPEPIARLRLRPISYLKRFPPQLMTKLSRKLLHAGLWISVFAGALAVPTVARSDDEVDFTRQIQPIFARRCFKCHGPNETEGGLQLSTREGALAELDSGDFAIVAGDHKASVILDRIVSEDEDLRMPPEGKPVTPEEVDLIKRWIQQGAPFSKHWAFRKLSRPQVPTVKNQDFAKHPIDAFIAKDLEANGLKPNQPAGKLALIRRAHYDLTGLPPDPKEIDAFIRDDSPEAFEKVVDRLLESPQYGEKWARHWLDLVRYAETNGYERDSRKDLIWKYRDYVIRAFNEDKPFDRCILEQIAGDELADTTADSITATGFYRLGLWDDEPADRELARYDYLDDILRTTSETFLGMTLGCARCHDHKFDPISQKDYYAMLDFFSDIAPHGKGNTNHVRLTSAEEDDAFRRKADAKRANEAALEEKIRLRTDEFLQALKKKHPDIEVPTANTGRLKDNAVLPDSVDEGQEWEYILRKPADNWFEIAFDDRKWKKGPGGFGMEGTPGAIVRTRWKSKNIWLRRDFRLARIPKTLTLRIHHDEDAAVYLNGKLIGRYAGHLKEYKSIDISKEAQDVLQTGRNTLAIHCIQTGGGQYIDAGLIADEASTPMAVLAKQYGKEILGQTKLNEWAAWQEELAASRKIELKQAEEFAMAVAERGRQKTWILGRGSPKMKGEEVSFGFPQILDPPKPDLKLRDASAPTSGKRLALAKWVASADNPMTSRVIANRIWQHHFGRGLARTTSDFGFQGSPPTHPDLLDWLATELIDSGWRIKRLHKTIMMSNSYQMSSTGNSLALRKDPANDLFWRFNMRRLTAEEMRDSILRMGGTLNDKMFGPAIFPPLPPEVLATASRPNAAWGNSPPEEAARRSIYIHVKRSLRPPMLAGFDSPDTDTSCAVRVSTTVPTQALSMLNSQFMQQQAQHLASRLQTEHPQDLRAQVARAIRLTCGREPTDRELAADLEFIANLKIDERQSAEQALQTYCLMILNTNEFVYLD